MNNALSHLASYVLNALWVVTFFWAVGWILSRPVRRAGPWVEHKLWVAILILATVVPATPVIRAYLGHAASNGAGSAVDVTAVASALVPNTS